MDKKISIKAIRKANDNMIRESKGTYSKDSTSGFVIKVNTGRVNKSYTISNKEINDAYKSAKDKKVETRD